MMESKYLDFAEKYIPGGITKQVLVKSKKHGFVLGLIKWYGGWRQYVFFPEPGTIFNPACMDDISKFIRGLMDQRKNGHDSMLCEWEDCPECETEPEK